MNKRERVSGAAVTLYPQDWAMIDQYAKDQGFFSRSAALRQILAEWLAFKAAEWTQAASEQQRRPGAA